MSPFDVSCTRDGAVSWGILIALTGPSVLSRYVKRTRRSFPVSPTTTTPPAPQATPSGRWSPTCLSSSVDRGQVTEPGGPRRP